MENKEKTITFEKTCDDIIIHLHNEWLIKSMRSFIDIEEISKSTNYTTEIILDAISFLSQVDLVISIENKIQITPKGLMKAEDVMKSVDITEYVMKCLKDFDKRIIKLEAIVDYQ